jgi:hypothetical protein
MDGLPEINDALWITLFIIAGVLGYKALIVRMGDKKVVPTFLFVFDIESISETQAKINYEIGQASRVVITTNDIEKTSHTVFDKEQEVGSYFLIFDKQNVSSILVTTEHQSIERYL